MVTEGSKDPSLMEIVKIKKEKVTPPGTPNNNNSTATELNITDNLLDNILGERKPNPEEIKSSNEILADLFKVFNAAPPILDDDDSLTPHPKKKKHKKEKKVKKEKKRSRTNSECKSSADDESHKSKKRKLKKSKKQRDGDDNGDNDIDGKRHKKHKKSKDHDIKSAEKHELVVKKEKIDETIRDKSVHVAGSSGGGISEALAIKIAKDGEQKSKNEKNPPMQIQVSVTKDNDGSIGKRKIVIKSLVDSALYQDTIKEVEAKQKEKDREKQKEREKKEERERECGKERTRDREKRKHSARSTKSREKDHHQHHHHHNQHSHHRSRARSHSSSLSLSDEETYLRERDQRERNRERDREKDDFYGDFRRDESRDRDPDRRRHRSRNSFYRGHDDRRRSRSSSRHRRDDRDGERIDKKRLLEIARKNAITMLKNGTLPGTHNLDAEAKERALTKMRYGGKTVNELTEFCKKLSKGEANGYLSNMSGAESDIDADLEKPFHHPFVIKDRGPIVMNIKNSTPIPPKTAEQTKAILMQFPVSSGQIHRANESEWVPVEPSKSAKKDKESTETTATDTAVASKPKSTATASKPAEDVPLPTTDYGYSTSMFSREPEPSRPSFAAPIEPVPVPPPAAPLAIAPAPAPATTSQQSSDNIFADKVTNTNLDVTSIITKRLNAMRKLQENPMDSEAIKLMYRTQKDMSAWASSKFVPGQFTGSTGANILSTKELASGFQAWAKRDQLIATTPVSGGMGMHLLQKMGWKPGEGLGKEKNGSLQPLLLEVKLDKKGLVAEEENPQVARQRAQTAKKAARATTLQQAKQNFESKHPVSLLGELSAKRKFGAPLYELVMQEGPSHQRQFLYNVQINGQIFQPNTTSLNKKEAKANAAKYALQRMGFLPDVPTQMSQPYPPQPVPPSVQQMPMSQPYIQNNNNNAMIYQSQR